MSDQLWILGVILVVVGSLGNNFGTNLVSLDHKITEDKEKVEADEIKARNYSTNVDMEMASPVIRHTLTTRSDSQEALIPQLPLTSQEQKQEDSYDDVNNTVHTKPKSTSKCSFSLRAVGVFIFVTGNLLTFAAFGFAAQSLLAALESIQFVSNIACAHYIHHELITNRMIIATFMIVAGNILVVIFSEHATALYDSNAIIDLYLHNSAYHWYLVIAFLVWLSFHAIFLKYYNSRIFDKKLLTKHDFVEPFSFSVSSAIIGTQAVLQAKCMSMLIQVSARGDNQFDQATVYVILVAWLFFVVFWLRRLDLGLSLFPPLFIIPVLQVFFVFFAIICGGIFFKEFVGFGAGQWCGFVAGVSMILGGVYGLAPTDTKSVVVLPNIMAEEVLQDVKEQIEEVPEVMSSIKYNVETSIRNIITPRGSMTPRGGTAVNMSPRGNNNTAGGGIKTTIQAETSIRNKPPVVTSLRISSTGATYTASSSSMQPVPISSSIITPRNSSRNNSSKVVNDISSSLKGVISAVMPAAVTGGVNSNGTTETTNFSNISSSQKKNISSLSLSSSAYQNLLQQPHPDMAEGDDEDAITNENNSLRNSTSKSNFYNGSNTSKSNINNTRHSSASSNSNNLHTSQENDDAEGNNNNNNNNNNDEEEEEEEEEKDQLYEDSVLNQPVMSSMSKTKRKPSGNMQLPPIGSTNNSNNNTNVNNKIAVDNDNLNI